MFLLAIVSTIFGPALSSAVPQLVRRDQLTAANALLQTTTNTGLLIGPLFSGILYAAALKLFVLGALFIHLIFPISTGSAALDWGVFAGCQLLLAVAIGLTESLMARLKLTRVPHLLAAATILTAFGLLLVLR